MMDTGGGEASRIVLDREVAEKVRDEASEILSYLPPVVDPSPMLQELAHLHPHAEDVVLGCFFRCFLNAGMDGMDEDYYIAMAQALCRINGAFIASFERYFIEQCTKMQTDERGKGQWSAVRMAHLYATFVKSKYLPWRILAHLTLNKSSMSKSLRTFCKAFFKEMTCSDCYTFLKLICDRDIQQSIEEVYPEKGKRDKLFFIDYFDSL